MNGVNWFLWRCMQKVWFFVFFHMKSNVFEKGKSARHAGKQKMLKD